MGTGPRSRDGWLHAALRLRVEGSPSKALTLNAEGSADRASVNLYGTFHRTTTIHLPDGRTLDLPAGSTLRMLAVQ